MNALIDMGTAIQSSPGGNASGPQAVGSSEPSASDPTALGEAASFEALLDLLGADGEGARLASSLQTGSATPGPGPEVATDPAAGNPDVQPSAAALITVGAGASPGAASGLSLWSGQPVGSNQAAPSLRPDEAMTAAPAQGSLLSELPAPNARNRGLTPARPAGQPEGAAATASDLAGTARDAAAVMLTRAVTENAGAPQASADLAGGASTAQSAAATGPGGSGGMVMLASPSPTPAADARGAPSAVRVAAPIMAMVGQDGWADEIAIRLNMLIDRGDHAATIRLSPEHLGPLEVRVSVRESEASVWFGASQAETRTALEASLPRLRELLASSGLALANAGVFSQTPRDTSRAFGGAFGASTRDSTDRAEAGLEPAGSATLVKLRLLDVYA